MFHILKKSGKDATKATQFIQQLKKACYRQRLKELHLFHLEQTKKEIT